MDQSTLPSLSPIQPVSLREQVAAAIRDSIIEGYFKPNDHITEASLTEQLGVSRTPLREALILLEQEGLITIQRHRGCFVRAFTVTDVREIFSMRTTLENFAAELIINTVQDSDFDALASLIAEHEGCIARGDFRRLRRADMAFHRYLIARSDHRLLLRNWTAIVAQIAALLYLRAEHFPDYQESLAVEDHWAIIAAYRARDLAAVISLNRRINQRVQNECEQAVAAQTVQPRP